MGTQDKKVDSKSANTDNSVGLDVGDISVSIDLSKCVIRPRRNSSQSRKVCLNMQRHQSHTQRLAQNSKKQSVSKGIE